jgi:hypothetical protein
MVLQIGTRLGQSALVWQLGMGMHWRLETSQYRPVLHWPSALQPTLQELVARSQ